MIITIGELLKELKKLDQEKFVIIKNIDTREEYVIDELGFHIENGKWNYEIRVGCQV